MTDLGQVRIVIEPNEDTAQDVAIAVADVVESLGYDLDDFLFHLKIYLEK